MSNNLKVTDISEMSTFFFDDPATTTLYTLSLHDALPIFNWSQVITTAKKITLSGPMPAFVDDETPAKRWTWRRLRSEEHTSELQSQSNLVCRLLLEKKKKRSIANMTQNLKRADIAGEHER